MDILSMPVPEMTNWHILSLLFCLTKHFCPPSLSFSFLRPLQPLTLFFPSRVFWSLCPSVTLQTFVTPLPLFPPQPFFLSLAVFLIFLPLFLTLSPPFHLEKRVSCGPVSLGASRQILISGVSLCPLSFGSQ